MKKIIIILALAFVFVSCGEKEPPTLSELIIGSWCGIEEEMTSMILYPMPDGSMIKGNQKWEITFYKTGNFDFIVSLLMTWNNESCNVKFITKGGYGAFENNISFRPETTEILVTPYELKAIMEDALRPQMENFKNAFTGTMSVIVEGSILTIEGAQWQKI